MPAPECTCKIGVDLRPGTAWVIHCPLHAAAGDLYTALERTNDILGNQPHRDAFGIIEGRLERNAALLLEANPQRTTKEQKDDAK